MRVKTGMLIILGLMLMCSVGSAEELTLYKVDMEDYSDTPTGFFIGRTIGDVTNTTMSWNDTLKCIDFTTLPSSTGNLYIMGLYPATTSNVTFEIGTDTTGTCLTNIYTNVYRIHVQKKTTYYEVKFRYDNTTMIQVPFTSIVNDKFKLSIICDGVNETVTVKYNETLQMSQAFMDQTTAPPYTTLLAPTINVYSSEQAADTTCTFHLYSVEQSIPINVVTPYGSRDYTGFGGDYLRASSSTNGANYLHTNGGYGTIWADIGYPEQQAFIESLVSNGWELGIHFSQRLTDLSEAEAEATIDSEVATITEWFGVAPTCWCSLQNADNATHAAYAYANHGMTWRNGQSGVGYPFHGVYSSSWDWYTLALDNGIVQSAYTHGTDFTEGNAEAYTTDYPDFCEFVDKNKANGIKIVGFSEYYFRNTNQKDAIVSISKNDATELRYGLVTNGYPTNLYIDPEITGWSIKSKNGVLESIINITNGYSFGDQSTGSYTITKIPLTVTSNNPISYTVSTWSNTQKVWTLSSETQQSVTHVIGGFPADTDIDIYRDGIDYDTVTSNSTGYITWVYSGGFSEHTFEAVPHATAGVRDSFVSSWGNTVSMVGAIIVIALAGSMIAVFRGKREVTDIVNDLPGIILIVVLLVVGAIIFGQF